MVFSNVCKVAILGSFFLTGCQSTSLSMFAPGDKTTSVPTDEKQLDLTLLAQNFFSELFENKDLALSDEEKEEERAEPTYKEFNKENTKTNIRLAILESPVVAAKKAEVQALISQLDEAIAVKSLTSKVEAVGGVYTEDRETDPAAAINLSTTKLIYDANGTDFQIEAVENQIEAAKISVISSADNIAFEAYSSWAQLVGQRRVNKIFEEGFRRAEPLMRQIESVSLSGLSDRKALLSARKNLLELKEKYSFSQKATKLAEESFLHVFPNADLDKVLEAPDIRLDDGVLDLEKVSSSSNLVRENNLLQEALKSRVKSIEATKKPSVAFSASINAPTRNTLDDGTANAGLRLVYDFNDGGSSKAKIEKAKSDLSKLKKETEALINSVDLDFRKTKLEFLATVDKISALEELIDVSIEMQKMSKQQVVSGRSTIKDVLDIEVSLASLRIELIKAQTRSSISIITMERDANGLAQKVGWSF